LFNRKEQFIDTFEINLVPELQDYFLLSRICVTEIILYAISVCL